jgi:hypothetical protein
MEWDFLHGYPMDIPIFNNIAAFDFRRARSKIEFYGR